MSTMSEARKPLTQEKTFLGCWVSSELGKRVRVAAEKDGRSVSSYIRHALRRVQEDGLSRNGLQSTLDK